MIDDEKQRMIKHGSLMLDNVGNPVLYLVDVESFVSPIIGISNLGSSDSIHDYLFMEP